MYLGGSSALGTAMGVLQWHGASAAGGARGILWLGHCTGLREEGELGPLHNSSLHNPRGSSAGCLGHGTLPGGYCQQCSSLPAAGRGPALAWLCSPSPSLRGLEMKKGSTAPAEEEEIHARSLPWLPALPGTRPGLVCPTGRRAGGTRTHGFASQSAPAGLHVGPYNPGTPS